MTFTKVPHPESCEFFFFCAGDRSYLQVCGENLIFDIESRKCQATGKCSLDITEKPETEAPVTEETVTEEPGTEETDTQEPDTESPPIIEGKIETFISRLLRL